MKPLILIPVLLLSSLALLKAAEGTKPNIVFILADDLGWQDVGCFGSRAYQSPHIDALSKRGMIFTQAYAANPLCSPSRASIMTGQYPARIGLTSASGHLPEVKLQETVQGRAPADQKSLANSSVTRLNTTHVTLAETLNAAGYVTGHYGKWHLGSEPYSPLQQGFDVDVPHWSGPGPAGSYVAPWKFPPQLGFTGQPGEHIEDRMAREAVKFIESNKNRPFFLNYWSFSVHAPYDAKRSYVQQAAKDMDEDLPQRNPVYAAMVRSLDDAVGALVKALEENGLMDKTIIVFFSDNGGVNWQALKKEGAHKGSGSLTAPYENIPPTSNQPLRGGKASIYEGGTREPCFVVWPGVVKPGGRSEAMIQGMDFYPTLAEIAGAPLPADQTMDGRSFLAVLKGQATKARNTIFNFFPHSINVNGQVPAASVRDGDWKLIRFFNDGPRQENRHELYHLREDPGESKNLADAQPERVKALAALLDDFLRETKAVVPGPNPAYRAKATTAATAEPADDPLQGWKARGCEGEVKAGVLKLTAKSKAPFIALGAGKFAGPADIKFRIRSANGGKGKVEWLPTPQQSDQAKSVPFSMKAGDWQEAGVHLPVIGPLGIIRLYLPADPSPVELDWVELNADDGKSQRWDF